jgi:sulfate permease, SulP family
VPINTLFSLFFYITYVNHTLEIFSQHEPERSSEPINTLIKAFSSYGNVDSDLFRPIDSYLERLSVPTGHVLWTQYDLSDGLYVIESGVLRASYEFANPAQHFEESMVAGTLAGELSALSDSTRNATVIVEQAAVLWKLSNENIRRLQLDEPELARTFIRFVLKGEFLSFFFLFFSTL